MVRRLPIGIELWSEAPYPLAKKVIPWQVPAPHSAPAVQILERYRGTVDRVMGDTVDLTLENERGELSAARLGVAQMAGFGLSLTEDFECIVTKQGPEVRVKFAPIPRRPLSPEASTRLRAEIDTAYQDFDDD